MSASELGITLLFTLQIFGFRLLVAALAISIFIAVLLAVRGRLSFTARSLFWGAAFVGLFIPFERSISTLTARYNPFLEKIVEWSMPTSPVSWLATAALAASQLFPFVWFAGFIFFAIKCGADAKRTRRLLREGKIHVCAAYFSKWRSYIYLPPDFETAYTPAEQEMLIAHEKQHIAQHDPLWYRLLPIVQCVFWFCPMVHKAARLFQQDREFLCDERVTQIHSKRKYCDLLLREGRKKPIGRSVPGIVSDVGDVRERLGVFLSPIVVRKKAAAAAFVVMILLFGTGLIGLGPLTKTSLPPVIPSPITVFFPVGTTAFSNYYDTPHIAGMEQFVLLQEDGVAIDQQRMYDYAIAQGIAPEQSLCVSVIIAWRPLLFDGIYQEVSEEFTVSELLTETIFIPYDSLVNRLALTVFRVL